jgi:UDP-2,3-diacylglucosamine hydrolase
MKTITFQNGAKLYFASDFHLGAPDSSSSRERELKIISWLDMASKDADAIFLVGDIFDFWFEYRTVVPKGFIRFFSKIAELTQQGIQVYFFYGNHDMWMRNYFCEELQVTIISDLLKVQIGQDQLLIGHGDGIGPGDQFYKFLKKIFRNPIARWMFSWLHPDLGVGLATRWSSRSRINNLKKGAEEFRDINEWLYQFSSATESQSHHDFYIFGHRHLPIEMEVNDHSKYFNLGEWVNYCTYGVYENGDFSLLTYEG